MADKKIWAFFMYLSNHMWADEYSKPLGRYLPPRYEENNNVDVEIWDETMKFLAARQYNMVVIDVGDGIRYDSRPEISAPDAWDKKFLKKKLDEMRALGLEPIPKLNFSCFHDTWLKKYRRMISTPEYYAACADVIREVCEAFGNPRFIHLGLDEECIRFAGGGEAVHIRGPRLWWHDTYFYFEEAKKNGARPWVWADPFWYDPDTFAEKMPRDVLLSNFFYNVIKFKFPEGNIGKTMVESYEKLDRLGFEQIPCCSSCEGWGAQNTFQTLSLAKDTLTDQLVKGFMIVPWRRTEPRFEFDIKDNAHQLYVARLDVYPETLK